MSVVRNILFYVRVMLLLSVSVCVYPRISFRGAWIATVANIDWPAADAIDNPEKQQSDMINILDSLSALGINAVIFQVRPTADALYRSEIEPWSHWLTGLQGSWSDTVTAYDPLQFVIAEAHERGMEVHAWLNPYRINIATMDTSVLVYNHILRLQPDWFWKYGKQWYFDPAQLTTREWICTVVEDIVCRYAVDAIHMDDYFYPYPIGKTPLPDMRSYQDNKRGFDNIEDWRRDNVNKVVEDISRTVKETHPDCQFGISPFGVWRNADKDSMGSATQAGITNYDDLYADVLLWMRNGWIDYVIPQLYWEIGKPAADYEVLAHWWAEQVAGTNCKLYIGMAPYRLENKREAAAWKTGNEIARQMRLNRTIDNISGECFYSTAPLLRNPRHVCDSIKAIYKSE